MTPTETSALQQERDGVIRSSAWVGRVEQLKEDMVKLQAFIETLTPEERTGPMRTVNQVRALGWGIALQMEAAVLRSERPNAPAGVEDVECPGCIAPVQIAPSAETWTERADGVGGVFSECRAKCPYRRDVPNGAGGTEHDCAHGENSPHLPIDQTPCEACVCPIFTSDDPEGDDENMRYAHEVEGRYWLPAGGGSGRSLSCIEHASPDVRAANKPRAANAT